MTSLLARLFGRRGAGTPGKVKISPLSTHLLRRQEPVAPTAAKLGEDVNTYVVRTQADQPPEIREAVRRQMFFDMYHRCGASGRCMLGGGVCTFPQCFSMRPGIKGGEILAEKTQIEEAIASTPNVPSPVKALLAQSQTDDNLEQTAANITEAINYILSGASAAERQQQQAKAASEDGGEAGEGAAAAAGDAPQQQQQQGQQAQQQAVKTTTEANSSSNTTAAAANNNNNNTIISDDDVGKLIILAVWRAVILVNARKDAAAVDSLLELLPRLQGEHQGAIFTAAAGWAVLHDMEARFYRFHLHEFPDLAPELWDPKVGERKDDQLQKVLAAAAEIDAADAAAAAASAAPNKDSSSQQQPAVSYFVEAIAYEAFSKEVSAIIARAQNAQEHQDHAEDPMGTPVVADSIYHYRHVIGGPFWDVFLKLALQPPMPEQKETAPGMTPRHVLDALGRSMLLHHVAMSFGPVSSEEAAATPAGGGAAATGAADWAATVDAAEQTGQPMDAETRRAKMSQENLAMQHSTLSRMRELVDIVKREGGETAARL